MKVARIYLRVSTEEQDLSRQDAIVKSTQAVGFIHAPNTDRQGGWAVQGEMPCAGWTDC